MRNLVGMTGRFLGFVLFHPQRTRVSPIQSCMKSIPVGFFVEGATRVTVNYKLITTRASVDLDEVAQANLIMILATIQKTPRSTEEICTNYLVKLCDCGNLSVAARLLEFLQNGNIFPGPSAYNAVMEAAIEADQLEIVIRVFKDLMMSGQSLQPSFCLNLAKGFMNTVDDVLLLRLVKQVSELIFPINMMVINKIIFAFGECRQFDKALVIFHQIKELKCRTDLITYNTILDILGRAGRVDEMLLEFSLMKEAGIGPDFISYNTLLNQLQKAGRLDLCLVYIKEMCESGIRPDLLTYTALIYSFGRSGNMEESLSLFDDMKIRQIRPSIYIYRSLINTAKKVGKVELALTLLEEMNASPQNLAGSIDYKRKRR